MKNKKLTQECKERRFELIRRINLCREAKENIIANVKKLNKNLNHNIISYPEYNQRLDSFLNGKSIEEWINYYNNSIEFYEKELENCESELIIRDMNLKGIITVIMIILAIGMSMFALNPYITGYFISNESAETLADSYGIENNPAVINTILIPFNATNNVTSGYLLENTYTFGTQTLITPACYTQINKSDLSVCLENEGTNARDAYFLVNFTLPAHSIIHHMIVLSQANNTLASTDFQAIALYNFSRPGWDIVNRTATAATNGVIYNLSINVSAIDHNDYISTDGRRIVQFMVHVNGTNNVDMMVDYIELNLSYEGPVNVGPYFYNITFFDEVTTTSFGLGRQFNGSFTIGDLENNYLNVSLFWYEGDTIIISNSTDGSNMSNYTSVQINGTMKYTSWNLTNSNYRLGYNYSIGIYACDGTTCNQSNSTVLFINNSRPTNVSLSTPLNDSITSFNATNYTWSNAFDADGDILTYILEIDNNINFESIDYYASYIKESAITSNISQQLSDDIYYWRIVSTDNFSNSSYSDVRKLTIDTTNPNLTLLYPANDSGFYGNVSIQFNVTDKNNITNCTLNLNSALNITETSIIKNITTNISLFNLNITKYNYTIKCSDAANNTILSDLYQFSVIYSTAFSGNTTNLSAVNISDIENLVIEVPEKGKIIYLENIDLSNGSNIDLNVNISTNYIEVNSTGLPELNKSANLSFYSITFSNPEPLMDGSSCPVTICQKIFYNNNTFVYNVTKFTIYSSGETNVSGPSGVGAGGTTSGGSGGDRGKITTPKTPAPTKKALFDIISELIKSEIIPGEGLATKISLVNFGPPGKMNVTLDYIISDLENNTILTQQEIREVEIQIEFIKTFDLPLDLKIGEYKLTIGLTYPGQKEEAVSQNSFQVISKVKKEKLSILLVPLQTWIIIAETAIIILLIILWKTKLKKFLQLNKRQIIRTKEDIKKDIMHIKNDLDALEIVYKDDLLPESLYKQRMKVLNQKLVMLNKELSEK